MQYTFADAHQRDFYVRVAEDAVIGSSTASHTAALAAMEYLQSGARRSTAELIAGIEVIHPIVPLSVPTQNEEVA